MSVNLMDFPRVVQRGASGRKRYVLTGIIMF